MSAGSLVGAPQAGARPQARARGSLLADVLAGARRGLPAGRMAAELGVDRGLVEAALDHWVRLGVVTSADALMSCGSCDGAGPADRPSSLACAGCPFRR